jgi:hypothetical protein
MADEGRRPLDPVRNLGFGEKLRFAAGLGEQDSFVGAAPAAGFI